MGYMEFYMLNKVKNIFRNPILYLKKIRDQIVLYYKNVTLYGNFSFNLNSKKYWNERLSNYDNYWRDENYHHIIDLFEKEKEFSLLDIGCALGDGPRLLKKYFPLAKITGADISEVGINKAKSISPEINFIVLDIIKDKIDGYFDYIIIIETLEHFSDPFPVVDKCLNHCDSLIISTPYSPDYQGKMPFIDEHKYAFNEKTFERYNSKVIQITEFLQSTQNCCIIHEIKRR